MPMNTVPLPLPIVFILCKSWLPSYLGMSMSTIAKAGKWVGEEWLIENIKQAVEAIFPSCNFVIFLGTKWN